MRHLGFGCAAGSRPGQRGDHRRGPRDRPAARTGTGTGAGARTGARTGARARTDTQYPSDPEDTIPSTPSIPNTPSTPSVPPTSAGQEDPVPAGPEADLWPLYADMNPDRSDWYYIYVRDLSIAGVVGGYPDNTYRPQGLVTWARRSSSSFWPAAMRPNPPSQPTGPAATRPLPAGTVSSRRARSTWTRPSPAWLMHRSRPRP